MPRRRRSRRSVTPPAEVLEGKRLLSASGPQFLQVAAPAPLPQHAESEYDLITVSGDGKAGTTDSFSFESSSRQLLRVFHSLPIGPYSSTDIAEIRILDADGLSLPDISKSKANAFADARLGEQDYIVPPGKWTLEYVAPTKPSSAGPFSLSIATKAVPEDDHADEVNPDATEVTPDPNTSTIRLFGHIDHPFDTDTFRFYSEVESRLFFKTRESRPAVNGGSGFGPGFVAHVHRGWNFLTVEGHPGFRTGHYDLTLHIDDAPDALSDAPPVIPIGEAPTVRQGRFETSADVDVVSFHVSGGAQLRINNVRNADVQVLDQTGQEVLTTDGIALLETSGLYSLRFSPVNDAASNYFSDLQLIPLYFDAPGLPTTLVHSSFQPATARWFAAAPDAVYELSVIRTGSPVVVLQRTELTTTAFQLPEDLGPGEYKYWVRAHRPNGAISRWSSAGRLKSQLAPEFTTGPATGRINVHTVSDTRRFEMNVRSVDEDGISGMVPILNGTGYLSGDFPAGTYEIRVRAVDSNSTDAGPWSEKRTITVGAAPQAPADQQLALHTLSRFAPDKSSLEDYRVTLTLTDASPNAASFSVPVPHNPVPVPPGIPILPPGPIHQTRYELRVVDAESGALLVDPSQMNFKNTWWLPLPPDVPQEFSFDATLTQGRNIRVQSRLRAQQASPYWVYRETVISPSSRPSAWVDLGTYEPDRSLESLQHGHGNDGAADTLQWQAAPNILADGHARPVSATDYDIEIRDLPSGTLLLTLQNRTGLSTELPKSLQGRRLSASIRPNYADGIHGEWSQPVSFTALAPSVKSFVPAATADATPMLEWQAGRNHGLYEIWITDTATGQRAYHATGLNAVTHRISDALPAGEYQVWIREHLSNGSRSRWGSGQPMSIGTAPDLRLSGDQLQWDAVRGATHYELWTERQAEDGTYHRVSYDRHHFLNAARRPHEPGTYRIWVRAVRSEAGDVYRGRWSEVLELRTV